MRSWRVDDPYLKLQTFTKKKKRKRQLLMNQYIAIENHTFDLVRSILILIYKISTCRKYVQVYNIDGCNSAIAVENKPSKSSDK